MTASHTIDEGAQGSLEAARAWLAERRRSSRATIQRIPLTELPDWRLAGAPLRLEHVSGRFFTVEGYATRLERGAEAQTGHQPLINQPEIGVLGFLARSFEGTLHLLAQAKMEPGNVARVQLAPTVQATWSNYTRVHGGRAQPLLGHFLGATDNQVLVNELQPEQAAYFLAKRNRNMVVETTEDVDAGDAFRWLTVRQLRALLATDHAVNMDARSVISCLPLTLGGPPPLLTRSDDSRTTFARRMVASARPGAPAEHEDSEVTEWLAALRSRSRIVLRRRALDALPGWRLADGRLAPAGGERSFEVGAIAVGAADREVAAWTQPMLERAGVGRLGLLCQQRGRSLHLLVHATLEPGVRGRVQLSPTLACHDDWDTVGTAVDRPFGDWFRDPEAPYVRFTALHSEEGGRFDHFVYRYLITEAPAGDAVDAPSDYRWVTVDQLARLRAQGIVSIELRNLLACLGAVTSLGT